MRHETFHALWRFAKASMDKADVEALYSHFPQIDKEKDLAKGGVGLDEAMAHEFEKYASGEYVSPTLAGKAEKAVGGIVRGLGGLLDALKIGRADSVGKDLTLKGFYDQVLAGKLGSGALGVEMRKVEPSSTVKRMNAAPETGGNKDTAANGDSGQPAPDNQAAKPTGGGETVEGQASNAAPSEAATLEKPAASNVPGQRFYRLQAGEGVWIVGELVVSDVDSLRTSDKGNLSDATLQNRMGGKEREGRINQIAANPNPRLMGTVNEQAGGGFVWTMPNGDVFIGNTRTTGATEAYARGTADELREYMIHEADARGIEIPEGVTRPLVHFVLRRIESADGKATIQDVVRMTNESTTTEMTSLEKAKNDADVVEKENLAGAFAFRPDGRIDETKSGDAIGRFRQATRAVGLVGDKSGMLTKEGQERIFGALLAHFLKGADAATVEKAIGQTEALDMENEMRALVREASALETLAKVKPRFDVRDAVAEILPYYMEWLEKDAAKREETGKGRGESAKRARRSWEAFMSQGDMFRQPGEAARIVGDLLAASRELRSFDREDAESDAGKQRAQRLVMDYLEAYARNAAAANDETDMFGTPPATREDLMRHHRANGGTDGGARFSFTPQAQRERDEVVTRYTKPDGTKRRGWMLAPNGRPTRLTEEQWVTVNTPNFRANYFGFYNLPKHEFNVISAEAAPFNSVKEGVEWAKANGVVGLMKPSETNGKGAINISVGSVSEMLNLAQMNKSVSKEAHFAALAQIRNIIRESELADRHPHFAKGADGQRSASNGVIEDVSIDVLYGAMRFGSETYRVKTTLRRYRDDNRRTRAYAYEVSEIEVLAGKPGSPESSGTSSTSITGDILLQGVRNSKGKLVLEDFSKVLDENGEPMVVAHSTDASFTIFRDMQKNDAGWLGAGFYFFGDRSLDGQYGDNVMECFLNVRNPYYLSPSEHVELAGADSAAHSREFSENLRDDGYDGVYFNGDGNSEYAVFSPSQIKSATDNNGDFSENPDVRFSVAARLDEERRELEAKDGGARFSVDGAYNPRSTIPNVRGGWNEKKILRYLKANPSLYGVRTAARLISEFDTVDELKDHMFYHGTRNLVGSMQPSMTQSERWAQEHGGGGYGQRYWGISVSKSKKVASNFGNPSPGVSIYPVVLAKGAKVIDRPDLTDAADVEDHIAELWNDGVDAVRLGDWSKDTSEQELLVLNPRAICNIGTADSYRYFKLGSDENPLDIKDDAHIARMLEAAREYADYSPVKRFGKPVRPSLFYLNGTDGTIGEMKPREVVEAEKAQYEKDLAAWRESEQGIAAAEYEWKMRDTIRFSVASEKKTTVQGPLSESDQTPPVQFNGGATSIPLTLESADPVTKFADSISQDGAKSPADFLTGLVHALGSEETNPDKTQYFDIAHEDGKHLSLRVANHRATAAQYREHGNTADVKTSIVVKMSDKPFRSDSDVEMTEHVYFSDKLTTEREAAIANAVADWIATGEWNGPAADQVNMSPRRRYSIGGVYTGTAADYANRSREGGADGGARFSVVGDESGRSLATVKVDELTADELMRAFTTTDKDSYSWANLASHAPIKTPTIPKDKTFARNATRRQMADVGMNSVVAAAESDGRIEIPEFGRVTVGRNALVHGLRMAKPHRNAYRDLDNPATARAMFVIGDVLKNSVPVNEVVPDGTDGNSVFNGTLLLGAFWDSGELVPVVSLAHTARLDSNWNAAERTADIEAIHFLHSVNAKSLQGSREAKSLPQRVLSPTMNQADEISVPELIERVKGELPLFSRDVYAHFGEVRPQSEYKGLRYSISGVYTGTAADYANRSRQGGVDDGPSLLKIGTGEGAQVYGWGLYGSTVRGVAEGYAKDAREYNAEKNGKRIDLIFPKNMLEAETAKRLMENGGDVRKTIEKLKRKGIGSAIIKELEEHGAEYSVGAKHEHLYEQTFFTDRAPGDESHLLKWYEPVSEEQFAVIGKAGLDVEEKRRTVDGETIRRVQISKDGELLLQVKDKSEITGQDLYGLVAKALGSPQAASEFLARAGIDGVKYPVDSYGGKGVKDGDEVGWNYVSFRDEHIRVDHKWTDGQMRYSIAAPAASQTATARYSVNPNLRSEIDAALNTGVDGGRQSKRHEDIVFSSNVPIFPFLGLTGAKVVTDAQRVRKMVKRHHLTAEQIANFPDRYSNPAAVMQDGLGYIILTDAMGETDNGESKPICIALNPRVLKSGEAVFLATAMSHNAAQEYDYYQSRINGGLLYVDENKIAGLGLEEETESILRTRASGDDVKGADDFSLWRSTQDSISKLPPPAQLAAAVAKAGEQGAGNGEQEEAGAGARASVEAPRRAATPYPNLATMSDEDLVAAALAARIVTGDRKSIDKGPTTAHTYGGLSLATVENYLRRVKPSASDSEIALLLDTTARRARDMARAMREDLDRGVSESAVAGNLDELMRDAFGREMAMQTNRGRRFGRFGAKAEDALAERQARIVATAVRNQTGIEAEVMENATGINLAESVAGILENELNRPPQGAGAGQGELDNWGDPSVGAGGEFGEGGAPASVEEVSAKVKAAVDEMLAKTGAQSEADAERRRERQEAAERRREEDEADREAWEASGGGDVAEGGPGDVAAAVRKAKVELRNPRHLALFVVEFARRYWVRQQGMGADADPWGSAVAMQFLRKTAQDVYGKLVRTITYSRSRETSMRRVESFGTIPTVGRLVNEMEYVGALINARRIKESAQSMCEGLDRLLKEKLGATGRFKADDEELRRAVPAELELRARYMRHVMWLTPEGCTKEAEELAKELAAAQAEFDEAGAAVEQSRTYAEAMRKVAMLREFGGLRYKRLAEIEAAVRWWQDAAEGGAREICDEWTAREERTTRLASVLAAAFRNPAARHAVERGLAQTFGDFVHAHMGFSHLLRDLMRFAGEKERAEAERVVEWLELEVQKAGTRAMTERRTMGEEFRSAVERIYGRKFAKVVKDLTAEDARFERFMGETDAGVRVMPTRARALQLYASLVQTGRPVEVEDPDSPNRTMTVWEGGYHDNIVENGREGQAEELAKLLTAEDMNLIAWMRKWYERNREGLSDVSQALFGVGVYAEAGNYMPVKMLIDPQGMEKPGGNAYGFFPKALTPRVRNKRDFDTTADILAMWGARMEEAAQWKAHAELGLELRGIFGRSELQKAIVASHGRKANADVQAFVTDILSGHGNGDASADGARSFIDEVRGLAALGALGGNVGVMLKQTTSIPALGFEVGMVKTAQYFATAFTPEGWAAIKTLWRSQERVNRWTGGNTEAVENALNDKTPGKLKWLMIKSMATNKAGDVVPCLVMGQGIYRDALRRGMGQEDAMAYTWMLVERTQQSSRVENRSAFQRRGKLGNIIYQFLTTQQQYLQYELRTLREVVADPKSARKWGGFLRAVTLNHLILSSAYFWVGELYKALLGQEPPEDRLADWVVGMLTGPYGALYGIGLTTADALREWIKPGSTFGRSGSSIPSLQWLETVVAKDPTRVVWDTFDGSKSWDDVLDDLNKWLSDFNATYRDLSKLYRYRVKEEPQKRR